LRSNDRLGRFEIRSELGRGGFADVYLAFDPGRGEEVALKVYRLSLADPEALEAEKRGVALQRDIAASVPEVAAIYEWGSDDGYFWVSMEFVPGTDLSRVLEKEALSEERAVAIAIEICRMLEVCHAFVAEGTLGVVHGDIKPENLRLQDGDRLRVLDFGIAKPLSGTSTRNLFGSSMYRPPEYLANGHVNRHTDLWAVGVVLYLMVSRQRPFVGRNDEELDTKIRLGEPPRALPEERSSPRLRRLVYRCLRFDVRERYGSARELREDLEAVAAGRTLAAERPDDPLDTTETLRLSGRPARREPSEGGEDPGATRRTRMPEGSGWGGETAAFASVPSPPPPPPPTLGSPAAPSGPLSSAPTGPFPVPPERRRKGGGCAILIALAAVAVTLFGVSEMAAWSKAEALRRDLVTEARPDVSAAWERYREASRHCLLCLGLLEVKGELHDQLVKTAERTLSTYRTDDPTTKEGDWHRAYAYLQAAVDLSPSDGESRARMLYCRGQLDRIEAQRLTGEARRRKYADAVSAFEEAAAASKSWPDPYLGLAWIYSYGQRDVDKLRDVLEKVESRGYPPGRREKAMLADSCWKQGYALEDQAQRIAGREEEPALLERARSLFEEAISTYGEIPGFAAAESNRRKAQVALANVESRLTEIDLEKEAGSPGSPPPPPADEEPPTSDEEPPSAQ
jgi:serine/threonine protein kinase